MRRAVIGIALAVLLATVSAAAMPPVGVEPWEMAPGGLDSSAQAPQNDRDAGNGAIVPAGMIAPYGTEEPGAAENGGQVARATMGPGDPAATDGQADCPRYGDDEINEITNVVNGEVGGICGTVCLTYTDGSQLWADASVLRSIHARVVDNQVRSSMFPATVSGCVGTYWSTSYTGTAWRESTQWQSCRQAVVDALAGGISVPSNVYAATCDANFAIYYPGWYLWARVDWDTGWYSGTFYYYAYG